MKLSIITINLNNLNGLKRTIESVLSQTWRGFEHIVIDGASMDGSADFLKENEAHFSYWVSEPDNGVYAAMNKGIEKSQAEYLLFLNSGDFLRNDEVLLKVLPDLKEHMIIYGDMIVENRVGKQTYCSFPDKVSINYLVKNYLPHPCTFFHKSVFSKVGLYNELNEFVSDWQIYMLAIFRDMLSYKHLSIPVSVFNLRGKTSEIQNVPRIEQGKMKFLMTNTKILNADFFNQYWQSGKVLRQLNKSRLIKGIFKLGLLKYLKAYFKKFETHQ